ncbi:MAG: hypothetical protein SWX82_22490 [Cyanobacteriota bacterium]|nr:hypothetical protein [Cyanobacteriota bacterium]
MKFFIYYPLKRGGFKPEFFGKKEEVRRKKEEGRKNKEKFCVV